MVTKQITNRILMIGPGEGVGGGISALIENIMPVLENRVALFYLPTVKNRSLKDSGKLSMRNLFVAGSQYFRFLAALIRFRPQIIHLHTSQGIAWIKDSVFVIIGKLARCHVILHIHGGNFDEIYDGNPRLVQAYTRKILRLSDAVIAVSTDWKNRLSKIVSNDRVFILKNCVNIDTGQLKPSNSSTENVNILFLARIGQQKGAFDLIDAVQNVVSVGLQMHLWMVGPEEQAGDFEKARERLEKYHLEGICEVVGPVSREKAHQFFRDANFFVLPSYYEGLPMVVLEAMAAWLPIVATPVGGIPEVVQDGYNGYLIPIGDIQGLANRLISLIKDPDLRIIMGKRSREIAERDLDAETYVDRLVNLYSSMIEKEEGIQEIPSRVG